MSIETMTAFELAQVIATIQCLQFTLVPQRIAMLVMITAIHRSMRLRAGLTRTQME
jgi:hypothetical protein